ncbi:MAG: hypothetical protein WB588_01705 [Dehalococcoidia bacterium]
MTLNRRIQRLEDTVKPKPVGCNPAVLIVRYEDEESGHQVKTDSCEPTHEEIEKHLKHMKDSGQCQDCLGSCALDWGPGGFANHKLTGERSSSSSSPNILVISCTSEEARELTRRIMNGERTE